MNRRQLLVRLGAAVFAVTITETLGCGGGTNAFGGGSRDTDAGATDGGTQDGGTQTQTLTFTSSTVQAHTHDVVLELTLLASPPNGNTTKTTSVAAGHSHSVTLSTAELQTIQSGGVVTRVTTLDSGHTHSFSFQKA